MIVLPSFVETEIVQKKKKRRRRKEKERERKDIYDYMPNRRTK